jgi:hypothetical protein
MLPLEPEGLTNKDQKVKNIEGNDFGEIQKLPSVSLELERCYGYSLIIPLCRGYTNLNREERILVETFSLYPDSYSYIKRKILEFK